MYVSWANGLPQSKEALKILKDSGIVSGVELSNIDGQVDMIQDAGLKVSSHTPGLSRTLNLANPDYMEAFKGEQGARLLHVIRSSDAPTVGFHCGYSAERVYKMKAFPNVPRSDVLFTDEQQLLDRITQNVVLLEQRINNGLPEEDQKQVVLETMDWSREKPIPWEAQTEEAIANRTEIETKMNALSNINIERCI